MEEVCFFCDRENVIVARHSNRLLGFVGEPVCHVCFNQLSRCSDGLSFGNEVLELVKVVGRGVICKKKEGS